MRFIPFPLNLQLTVSFTNHKVVFCLFLGVSVALSSCQVAKVPASSPAISVPDSYVDRVNANGPNPGMTDSLGIGDLPYRTLFTDDRLVALIDTAVARNLDLKIAWQRIAVAQANYGISRGALLPQVDAVATTGVDRFGRYTLNGVGNFDTNLSDNVTGSSLIPNPTPDFFVGFRSNWEVDIWGKLQNRRNAAYKRVMASQEGRHLLLTTLISDVSRLYYTLLALDGELEIIRENVTLQQQAVELVEVQKAAGRVTELAVQQFRAQLLNTQSLAGGVQQQIVDTENQLNVLLGRYPRPVPRGVSIRDQQLPPTLLAGIPAQLLQRRPDIRQAERELDAANIDVAVARAEFLPSLNLSPYLGLNAFRPDVLLNPQSVAAGILGGLAAPVFNRRLLKGNLRISQAQSQEAYYTYQRTVLTGVSEVTTSLKGLENYRSVADLQTKEVAELRLAATTSDDLFGTGYATYLEVITAQRSILQAELNLMNTKRAQFLSLVDLYRALGGGWN
ncbi:TolC family protein [Spirosoma sp. KUDC1026]|uniref:TolC family protein n=1 Tax=Spirosoma sp. KUDC1026 TaxID=2745947 RepID=UPI00159BD063|nr:efflux transporter outer membrane subunit [Spirosoma sp. KUDC1026]QKZ14305.1 efflux transporter outer membrane subunit [Spirosoma sp. KUDC1026]